jgi:Na+-translocating ferredoxin:NAD+ oxidoreductase RnfD subunit
MMAVINSVLSSLLIIYAAKYYFFVFAVVSHIIVELLTSAKDVFG